jgi:hypothetical protein
MIRRIAKFSLVILMAGIISGCAGDPYYHGGSMRGQIVSVDGDQVIMCIGSSDGAEAGMVLEVLEVRVSSGVVTEDIDFYELLPVGEVTIKSIMNEHFARGSITRGEVHVNNVVELPD